MKNPSIVLPPIIDRLSSGGYSSDIRASTHCWFSSRGFLSSRFVLSVIAGLRPWRKITPAESSEASRIESRFIPGR
jgi:hypothetical protein